MPKLSAPKRAYRIAAIPDLHVPAHDSAYVRAVAQCLADQEIDAFVQLGDVLDHESISRFVIRSPAKIAAGDLPAEWGLASSVIDRLLTAARTKNRHCLYYQLEGNHEKRLKSLEDQLPMLRGLLDLRTCKEFGFADKRGVWVNSDSQGEILKFSWRDGKIVHRIEHAGQPHEHFGPAVSFIHGWKYNMHNAKMTADQMPWPGLVCYGHTHTIQQFTTERWGSDLNKSVGATVGWGGLPPDYIQGRPNRWAQGFAIIDMNPAVPGHWDLKQMRVIDGKVIGPDGKIYGH